MEGQVSQQMADEAVTEHAVGKLPTPVDQQMVSNSAPCSKHDLRRYHQELHYQRRLRYQRKLRYQEMPPSPRQRRPRRRQK